MVNTPHLAILHAYRSPVTGQGLIAAGLERRSRSPRSRMACACGASRQVLGMNQGIFMT